MRNPLILNYDQNLQSLVVFASNVWSQTSVTTPTMFRNDDYELTLQVFSDSSTTPATQANLAAINTASLVLDVGNLGVKAILSSNSASFTTANLASGQLTCTINTHSANLTASILTMPLKSYYMQIVGEDNSVGNTQQIMVTPLIIRNTIGTGS